MYEFHLVFILIGIQLFIIIFQPLSYVQLCIFISLLLSNFKRPGLHSAKGSVRSSSEWRTPGWTTFIHVVLSPSPAAIKYSIPVTFPCVWIFLRSCLLSCNDELWQIGIEGQEKEQRKERRECSGWGSAWLYLQFFILTPAELLCSPDAILPDSVGSGLIGFTLAEISNDRGREGSLGTTRKLFRSRSPVIASQSSAFGCSQLY